VCGLVGVLDTRGRRPVDTALLERMNDVQRHRGPDEHGIHVEPGLGLGHRRLSIIDLASGQQPLWDAERSAVVVYNGEIYNFMEVREALVARGYAFRTRCDTEVVVNGWREWGPACVERFRGMFAFALWDPARETLFLARDRLGIKPLHYALLADGTLAFGSELKSLMLHPGFPRALDPHAVEAYFAYGYVPDPKTVFAAARKLPPGHTLTVRRGEPLPEPRCYWDVRFSSGGMRDEGEVKEALVERLRDAVRVRLIAEVPLGAFLSGGVDSSAVVAMMAGLDEKPVTTCSISFGDPAFNESRHAEAVARRYATDHHVEQVEPDDFGLVERLASLYDEPYADSSAMPTYRVCELARRRVTVALSGDGGDETLAGYRRYRWHAWEERVRAHVPARLRAPLFGTLGRVYPKADWAPKVLRAKATFQSLARGAIEGYFHSVSLLGDDLRRQLYSPGFRRELQGYRADEVLREVAARAPTEHPLSLVQYLDMKTYLPGDILTKVDRASMAHSLEVRVPILDHHFVEWAGSVDPALKLRGREGKYLLKRALEPHLPRETLYRPKMGFSVPLAAWFRGPLRGRVREALLGPVLAGTGIFDRRFLERLVSEHQSGLRDFSAPIWSLLMFEAFQRRIDAAGAPAAAGAADARTGTAD